MASLNPFDDLNRARSDQQKELRPKYAMKLEVFKTLMSYMHSQNNAGHSLLEVGVNVMDIAEDVTLSLFKDKTP